MGTHSMAEPPPNSHLRHDIMATTPSRTDRTSHENSDRATRREGAARHGYNGASKQSTPSRQPTDRRRHPHQGDDGASEERPEASKHGETRQAAKSGRGTIARRNRTASAHLPAYRVARRGERRRTDPTDGTIDEARDETSRRAISKDTATHPARTR